MKDLYYFIGFLTIAYHIYTFLYYDYLDETIQKSIDDIDDIFLSLSASFNVVLPYLTSLLWLLIAIFTFNWLLFLFRFIIVTTCHVLFENDKFFSRSFAIINIIFIIFALYNTYYLKLELLDYCLTLI